MAGRQVVEVPARRGVRAPTNRGPRAVPPRDARCARAAHRPDQKSYVRVYPWSRYGRSRREMGRGPGAPSWDAALPCRTRGQER